MTRHIVVYFFLYEHCAHYRKFKIFYHSLQGSSSFFSLVFQYTFYSVFQRNSTIPHYTTHHSCPCFFDVYQTFPLMTIFPDIWFLKKQYFFNHIIWKIQVSFLKWMVQNLSSPFPIFPNQMWNFPSYPPCFLFPPSPPFPF